MFDPKQLLGNLVRDALSENVGFGGRYAKPFKKRKHKSRGMGLGTKVAIGAGIFALAAAAYEHFSKQGSGTTGGSAVPPQPNAAPSPPPSPAGMPPPPPGSRTAPAPPPPPPGSAFASPNASTAPQPHELSADDAALLVRAMIAAAAADGVIDAEERAFLLERVRESGADDEGIRHIEAMMANPPRMHDIVLAARTPFMAEQVYAASCLAIDIDTEAERGYLAVLARSLGLSQDAVGRIHDQLDIEI